MKLVPRPLAMDRNNLTSPSNLSLNGPRAPKFAEATTVHSPVEINQNHRPLFADPHPENTSYYIPQAQPPGTSFYHIYSNSPSQHHVEMPIAPAPLLSSNITEHKPPRQNIDSPLSRTLRGKQLLEKYEQGTEKEQAKDLVRVDIVHDLLR